VADFPDDALDEMVHNLASSIGSDTNNGGFDDQARFLLKEMGIQNGGHEIMAVIDSHRKEQKGDGE